MVLSEELLLWRTDPETVHDGLTLKIVTLRPAGKAKIISTLKIAQLLGSWAKEHLKVTQASQVSCLGCTVQNQQVGWGS